RIPLPHSLNSPSCVFPPPPPSTLFPYTTLFRSEVRQVGARISIFRDGDVAAAIATAEDDEEVDVMLGIGGSPEAVIAAAALKCMGGEIQCRLWPRNEEERRLAVETGQDLDRVMTTEDLVSSDNVFFAATGVTGGEFLQPVVFLGEDQVVTHSVIMRSK